MLQRIALTLLIGCFPIAAQEKQQPQISKKAEDAHAADAARTAERAKEAQAHVVRKDAPQPLNVSPLSPQEQMEAENLYLKQEPVEDLIAKIAEALHAPIKEQSDQFYRKICGAHDIPIEQCLITKTQVIRKNSPNRQSK